MGDWAAAMGIEAVYIDKDTNIRDFKNELRWNELALQVILLRVCDRFRKSTLYPKQLLHM